MANDNYTPEQIQAALNNFYGTEAYYRYSVITPNIVLTDGTKFLAEAARCYWLMDIFASHLPKYRDEGFAVLKLRKTSEHTCNVTIEDGNGGVFATQSDIHTSFPLQEIDLYAAPADGTNWVLMLPSEY